MKNKRRKRHWYYVVGVEMETVIQADYPATAEASLHDVVHQMLDPIDRHRFPRVVCNLVGDMTPWPKALALCALPRPVPKPIKPRRETTFATVLKRSKAPTIKPGN